jgi:hypothetical protein
MRWKAQQFIKCTSSTRRLANILLISPKRRGKTFSFRYRKSIKFIKKKFPTNTKRIAGALIELSSELIELKNSSTSWCEVCLDRFDESIEVEASIKC